MPSRFLGYSVSKGLTRRKDVSYLLESVKIEVADSPNTYWFRDVFNWNDGFAYDLKITLDPDHDYLAKSTRSYERSKKGTLLKGHFECTKFAEVGGLWFPVEWVVEGKAGENANRTLHVIDESQIELNKPWVSSDYEAMFPPNKQYYDNRDKTLYVNGIAVKD